MTTYSIWRCDLQPQHQFFEQQVAKAVARVLPTGRYVLAGEVSGFEKEFSDYIGVAHGVGMANATDALTLSLIALGIGAGDEVITTPYTAIPTVSSIVDAGATPVFVDIDPDTFLMDLEKVRAAISPRTRAIMPVHIFGNVVDIVALREIVGEKIAIVEDASQAHGSLIDGMRAGSFGDTGVFSFYPTKNLGAYGDGGIAVTNRADLDAILRKTRMYGMVDKDHISQHGVNSRIDELQAAILREKLPYLDGMNKRRREIAKRYDDELPSEIFHPQVIPGNVESNYHVYVTRCFRDREGLIRHLDSLGIQTNIYYVLPLHLQEATSNLGYKAGDLPASENLCSTALALPLYPEFTEENLTKVINAISDYYQPANSHD